MGAPGAGWISDRSGDRWVILICTFIVGAAGVWLLGSERITIALMGAGLAFLAVGGAQALIPAIIGDHAVQALQSKSLSVVFNLGDLGSALGPIIALGLISTFRLPVIYSACGLIFLATGVVIFGVTFMGRKGLKKR